MAEDNQQQDPTLPIHNVSNIMKKIIPPHGRNSKGAKELMEKCAREFISIVTDEAYYKCLKEERKIINGNDICCALRSLGLDDYATASLRYLEKYREFENSQENRDHGASTSNLLLNDEEDVPDESTTPEPSEFPVLDMMHGREDSQIESGSPVLSEVIDREDQPDESRTHIQKGFLGKSLR